MENNKSLSQKRPGYYKRNKRRGIQGKIRLKERVLFDDIEDDESNNTL